VQNSQSPNHPQLRLVARSEDDEGGCGVRTLKPFAARLMRCDPVRTRVDSVVNHDPECSAPVELPEVRDRHF
jgi:hypothetical protein